MRRDWTAGSTISGHFYDETVVFAPHGSEPEWSGVGSSPADAKKRMYPYLRRARFAPPASGTLQGTRSICAGMLVRRAAAGGGGRRHAPRRYLTGEIFPSREDGLRPFDDSDA